MSVEDKAKEIFEEVLDIKPEEVQADAKLDEGLGVDSTEMVEITVALKKAFNLDIENNYLNKSQTFNEIVTALKEKGAE